MTAMLGTNAYVYVCVHAATDIDGESKLLNERVDPAEVPARAARVQLSVRADPVHFFDAPTGVWIDAR